MDGIDPNIALSVRGIQLPDVGQTLAQIQQMRMQRANFDALEEQRQAQAELRRTEVLKQQQLIDAAKRAQDEEQRLRALYLDRAQQGKTPSEADLAGVVGPERAQKLIDAHASFQEKSVKTAGEAQDRLSRAMGAVSALPEGMRPGVYQSTLDHAVQDGWLSKDDALPYSPESVQFYANRGLSPDKQYENAHPKPVAVSPGTSLVEPTSGKTVYTAPEKKSFQSKDVLLNGKRATVNFDPSSGKHYDAAGNDVSAQVTPIPPASLIINDQRQRGSTMPDFAMTDARPTGPDANKPDPTIRMTPNGLHQAAQVYIATGQYPPTGRGTDPISVAQREAINAKVGAIAAAAGMDVPTLRAFYKSNASSLTQVQKSADAVQSFMATADKNADLLKDVLKNVPDTGIPIFNQPLRSFTANVKGDPNMARLGTYLQSVQNEYARIIAQPNLSGQLTDSARHEAENLLSPKATVSQMLASIDALKNEGSNRLISLGEQIQRITTRMQGGPSAPQTAAPTAPAGGQRIRVRGPNGETGTVPEGTPLPPGWSRVGG